MTMLSVIDQVAAAPMDNIRAEQIAHIRMTMSALAAAAHKALRSDDMVICDLDHGVFNPLTVSALRESRAALFAALRLFKGEAL